MKIHNDEKIIVIAILVCFLAGLFGFSFAYFSIGGPTATGNTGTGVNYTIPKNTKDVEFNAGNSALDLQNAYPGSKATKTFKVITGDTVTYDISISISANGFKKCANDNGTYDAEENRCAIGVSELVYKLKRGTTEIGSGDLTGRTGTISLTDNHPETQTGTIEYTLEIEFKNLDSDQNHNKNKEFSGNLRVDFAS